VSVVRQPCRSSRRGGPGNRRERIWRIGLGISPKNIRMWNNGRIGGRHLRPFKSRRTITSRPRCRETTCARP